MPEISTLGWLHTGIGVSALLLGAYTFIVYKVIQFKHITAELYLLCTVIVALTALGIFSQGDFNVAHLLAAVTLLALFVGGIAEKTSLFRQFSPYVQATCYTGTFLFHMIPAITDTLRRLPVDSPIVTEADDPLLAGFYLAFLVCYLVGLAFQFRWIHNNPEKIRRGRLKERVAQT